MDSMGSVLRRSGVKLRSSLGGSGQHADLQMVIGQMGQVKASCRAFGQAQHTLWRDLRQWAGPIDGREGGTENRAIVDVLDQLNELNALWSEAQREFADQVKQFRQRFQVILEGERQLEAARLAVEQAEHKETKWRREARRSVGAASGAPSTLAAKRAEEVVTAKQKHVSAEREKEAAQRELVHQAKEHEAVKMISVKDGLVKFSRAYLDLAQKCLIIFESGQAVAQQLPDVNGQPLQELKYTGSGMAAQAVLRAKERLLVYQPQGRRAVGAGGDGRRRRSGSHVEGAAALSSPPPSTSDLPPPYSEVPPPDNPFYYCASSPSYYPDSSLDSSSHSLSVNLNSHSNSAPAHRTRDQSVTTPESSSTSLTSPYLLSRQPDSLD